MARCLNAKTYIITLEEHSNTNRTELGSDDVASPTGPPPTLLPNYDGLNVTMTSDITCFHPNHDMASMSNL